MAIKIDAIIYHFRILHVSTCRYFNFFFRCCSSFVPIFFRGEHWERLICFINPPSDATQGVLQAQPAVWQKEYLFLVHYRKISMSPLFFSLFGQLLRDKSLSINYRQAAGGARTRFSSVVTAGHPRQPLH